jgi:hypothetical protein
VVGLVEGRTDEIVHAGVSDDEGLGTVLLDEENLGKQGSCLGDDEAAGFEEEMGGIGGEAFGEGRGVLRDLPGGIESGGAVVDAKAAAGVDVTDIVAVLSQVGDEGGDTGERGGEGFDFADLRANVDGDSGGIEPTGLRGFAIDGAGGFDVDAELVLAETGGDVGVGFCEDVRVDAEGEAGGNLEEFCAIGKEGEFRFRLDVEEEDTGLEG